MKKSAENVDQSDIAIQKKLVMKAIPLYNRTVWNRNTHEI